MDKVAGIVVNSAFALAAARIVQKATDGCGQLHDLGRGWAKSLMQSIVFVMRMATNTAKELPPTSEELK